MARIALVGDSMEWRSRSAACIQSIGHTVTEYETCAEFRSSELTTAPEILVIDRVLPDGDGLDISTTMANRHPQMGIVVLTACNSHHDRLEALKNGADHSLSQPVELQELIAIIESLARRLKVAAGWRIDHKSWHIVTPDGISISLTHQEYIFLCELNKNPSKTFSRSDIMRALGKHGTTYDPRSLDALVLRLRKKTSAHSHHIIPIKTTHGIGYSLATPLTSMSAT